MSTQSASVEQARDCAINVVTFFRSCSHRAFGLGDPEVIDDADALADVTESKAAEVAEAEAADAKAADAEAGEAEATGADEDASTEGALEVVPFDVPV